MRNTVLCSICSKKKDRRKGNLRARFRYLGSHIKEVAVHAKEEHLPMFILSGVYGLISADEPVPYYDHLLREKEVSALTKKITRQLRRKRIDEIRFYTKAKANWAPYLTALRKATKRVGALLSVEVMRDNV